MRQDNSKRRTILEAGFTVFAGNPSATLSDVAKAADVGRATLHRYFPSRADLIVALAEQAEQELDAAIDVAVQDATSHADALQRIMSAIIPLANRQLFLSNDPDAYGAAMADSIAREEAELMDAIDAARSEGSLPSDMPTPWIAQVFEGLVYAAWTAVDRQDLTPTQAATLAWRSFTGGVTGDTS